MGSMKTFGGAVYEIQQDDFLRTNFESPKIRDFFHTF